MRVMAHQRHGSMAHDEMVPVWDKRGILRQDLFPTQARGESECSSSQINIKKVALWYRRIDYLRRTLNPTWLAVMSEQRHRNVYEYE